jgi:hypothetical protein
MENGIRINTDRLLTEWDWGNGHYNYGWLAEIGYNMQSNWGISFAYLGRVGKGEIVLISPGGNIEDLLDIGGDFVPGTAVRIDFKTNFDSFEISVHLPPWQLNERMQLRAFLGPRFIWLRDNLDIEGEDGWPLTGDISDLDIDTENWLRGLQVGLDLSWEISRRFTISSGVKVGGYHADMENSVEFLNRDQVGEYWRLEADEDAFGFLGEAMAACEFRIFDNLSARLGYMLLYLSDTCRATNQLYEGMLLDRDFVDIPETSYPVVREDDTLYHGILASIIFRF